MEVMIFHRPQEAPAATWEDRSVRIAYNNYWVDFRDGKVFVTAEPSQPVNAADAEEGYYELIMAVENKYPGETRHQTALRLIKEAQQSSSQPENSADAYCQCGGGETYPYMPFQEMRCKKCDKPRR
jgi:hypothetical protein